MVIEYTEERCRITPYDDWERMADGGFRIYNEKGYYTVKDTPDGILVAYTECKTGDTNPYGL